MWIQTLYILESLRHLLKRVTKAKNSIFIEEGHTFFKDKPFKEKD